MRERERVLSSQEMMRCMYRVECEWDLARCDKASSCSDKQIPKVAFLSHFFISLSGLAESPFFQDTNTSLYMPTTY